uniref:Uncharacterized protein n=1 Tax=Heterorhabditis bacteriophora TaxID=37862 RepID=A0A1I7WPQ7_HETBA
MSHSHPDVISAPLANIISYRNSFPVELFYDFYFQHDAIKVQFEIYSSCFIFDLS